MAHINFLPWSFGTGVALHRSLLLFGHGGAVMNRNDRNVASVLGYCGHRGRLRSIASLAARVFSGAIAKGAALTLSVCALTMAGLNTSSAEIRSLLEARHDRVVLQQWDLSCGAAALATQRERS